MWYDTYASCMYDKISILIEVGIRFRIPWTTLTFFICFIMVHTAWGPTIKSQCLHFLLIIFLYILSFMVKGLWDRTRTTPFYFNFFLHGFFEWTMRLWDRTATTLLYLFSFNSFFLYRVRGFDSHGSHLFSPHFTLTLK